MLNKNLSKEQRDAVNRLRRMKVYKLMGKSWGDDRNASFSDWWYSVAHEVDTFESFDGREEYLEYLGEWYRSIALDGRSYRASQRWLRETEHLIEEEYR